MADSKETPVEAEVAAGKPSAPRRRGALRMLGQVALFSACFAVTLIPSWIYREQARQQDQHEAEPVPAEPSVAHVTETKKEMPVGALECLEGGDEALRRHQFGRALSYYQELLATASFAAPLVDYRIGLCYESLGQTEQAIAQYRKAISAATTPAL